EGTFGSGLLQIHLLVNRQCNSPGGRREEQAVISSRFCCDAVRRRNLSSRIMRFLTEFTPKDEGFEMTIPLSSAPSAVIFEPSSILQSTRLRLHREVLFRDGVRVGDSAQCL